jgi:bifunctional non-homologous end joining protein LigD
VPGSEVLAISVEQGLEGVIAKRRDSPYSPGQRTSQWIKVKNVRTQEVVIGGWAEGKGELAGALGALLLGIPDGDGLVYAGKVGTGFSEQARAELLIDLRAIAQDASPFTRALSRPEAALAHFVRPELVGEVRYVEWTHDGHLRHPSWRGLRADKEPSEVVREP